MRTHHFRAQKGTYSLNTEFLETELIGNTYWPLSLFKILKKLLKCIQSYEDALISVQKDFFLKKPLL